MNAICRQSEGGNKSEKHDFDVLILWTQWTASSEPGTRSTINVGQHSAAPPRAAEGHPLPWQAFTLGGLNRQKAAQY